MGTVSNFLSNSLCIWVCGGATPCLLRSSSPDDVPYWRWCWFAVSSPAPAVDAVFSPPTATTAVEHGPILPATTVEDGAFGWIQGSRQQRYDWGFESVKRPFGTVIKKLVNFFSRCAGVGEETEAVPDVPFFRFRFVTYFDRLLKTITKCLVLILFIISYTEPVQSWVHAVGRETIYKFNNDANGQSLTYFTVLSATNTIHPF